HRRRAERPAGIGRRRVALADVDPVGATGKGQSRVIVDDQHLVADRLAGLVGPAAATLGGRRLGPKLEPRHAGGGQIADDRPPILAERRIEQQAEAPVAQPLHGDRRGRDQLSRRPFAAPSRPSSPAWTWPELWPAL